MHPLYEPITSSQSLKRRRASSMKINCDRTVSALTLLLVIVSTSTFVQSFSTVAVRPHSSETFTRRSSIKNSDGSLTIEPSITDEELLRFSRTTSPKYIQQINRHAPLIDSIYANDIDDEEDDDDYEDYIDETTLRAGIRNFRSLLQSTGSEIVQTELQKQINAGPKHFIQQYDHQASDIEQIAMRTITEQLPSTAVRTLMKKQSKVSTETKKSSTTKDVTNQKDAKKCRRYNENLNFEVDGRVSVDEEIYLAQMIQLGVKLQQVKQQLEEENGGITISRTEWANAVQMSPKQLRQTLAAIRTAKHQLVTANIGLVHTVVKQFMNTAKAAGISTEELVQEGSIGLLRAAELFNPDRGVRFSTYAVVWIKGVLSNSHVTELVRVPSREKTKYNKIKKAQSDLMKLNGNDDSSKHSPIQISNTNMEELASMTGLSVKEIIDTQRRMNHISNIYSLDYEQTMHSRSGSDSSSIESTLPKQQTSFDDEEFVQYMQLQSDIVAAMARNLDAREARLLRLRYGLSSTSLSSGDDTDDSEIVNGGRTLQECADAMGLSYSRVHQLNERCLKKLRQAVEAKSLEEYLLTIA